MNGFSGQGFSNQSGPHFGTVVTKVYSNYPESLDNEVSQSNHRLTPHSGNGNGGAGLEVKSYHSPDLCDNCAGYSDHIEYLCHENELLHQLVDNLRRRNKDPQISGGHLIRKYETAGNGNGEEVKQFASNEVAVSTATNNILQQYGAAREEDKMTIARLRSEMDFFKALNQNTDSSWKKKLEDLQTEKDNVIKELQNFIAETAESTNRLTKELETVKHSKQESINQLTSEIFSVKSSNQTTIAVLTQELDKVKTERKELQERIFKLVHALAGAESKASDYQTKVKELNKELTKVQKESQEKIDELKGKLYYTEDHHDGSQTNLDKLTKDLALTKAQYHLKMEKISKEIEAMHHVSKAESSQSWRS